MSEFLISTGAVNVGTGIELTLDPDMSNVAAAASAFLPDGTRIVVKFEVGFTNYLGDGAQYCAGGLVAFRERYDSGEHLDIRDRLAFIEAGHAGSRAPIRLASSWDLFESGDSGTWVMEVDAPLAIAPLDIKPELLNLDLAPLRLSERFD